MNPQMFRNRREAAEQLADELKDVQLHNPVVLGIPRGGVVTAAVLAEKLGADMDVALARKLRHPMQSELAIGAISEEGDVFIEERFRNRELDEEYLEKERRRRLEELKHRRKIFRDARPAAELGGRTVILTDDGIATGSTMFSALQAVKAKHPRETIVAVPVASPDRFEQFRNQCDRAVAVMLPRAFSAIGQFYANFEQVDDEEVCRLLRQFAHSDAKS